MKTDTHRQEGRVSSLKTGGFWALFLLLIATSLLPFYLDRQAEKRNPDDLVMIAATEAIIAQWQEGDALWITPTWWNLPIHRIQGRVFGAERWPYPALLRGKEADLTALYRHRRVFALGAFNHPPVLPGGSAHAFSDAGEIYTSKEVQVRLWTRQDTRVLATLTHSLDRLTVSRGNPQSEWVTCPLQHSTFRCEGPSWLKVRNTDAIVAGHEVHWLFTHPSPAGEILELTWHPEAALDTHPWEVESPWIYVRIGPSLEAVRRPMGDAVRVDIFEGDMLRDTFEIAPNRYHLERRAIQLTNPTAPIRLRFHTSNPDARELLTEIDILSSLPKALRRWATEIVPHT